jgi:predicted transcriptional regulator
MSAVTMELDAELEKQLDTLCRRQGLSRDQYLARAIKALAIEARLDDIRRELEPRAKAIGWRTEEDVFRDVS